MSPEIILFDFDGTLADSFGATLAAGNRVAKAYGHPPLSEKEALALRGQGIRQTIQSSGIPLHQIPRWMRELKAELRKEIPNLKAHPGLTGALAALREGGIQLAIVTSNSRLNVELFLENTGWTGWFARLECGSNLFGKSRLITRLLRHTGVPAPRAMYVGDEVRDIEAARKAGVASAAVTWGFNDRTILTRARPDYLFDRPDDLRTLCATAR